MSTAMSGSSPFDQAVEKATPDTSVEANWAAVMEICDKAGQSTTGPKDCLKSVMKRLANNSKNIQTHALTLLDACVLNCGSSFHLEVATAEFVKEARNFLMKASPEVADKFKESLKKWAENEFKSDSKLSVIPTFYQALRTEGAYFGMGSSSTKATSSISTPSAVGGDDDLEKAIALSLKESQPKSQASSSLYPSMSTLNSTAYTAAPASDITPAAATAQQPAAMQVRALYDFEAVEDNELTFKTGDLITVLDNSDPNWWKGATWRGEGLFPVNFVSTDLSESGDAGVKLKKSVQFNEEVEVTQFDPNSVKIDEAVIDKALDHIQNADPTGSTEDSTEMTQLEEECRVMGPLIDQELEKTDSKHHELMSLNEKLTEAFQLYTQLMKDATNVPQYPSPVSYMQTASAGQGPAYLPVQQPPDQPLYTYANNPQDSQQAYYNVGAYPNQVAHPGQPQPTYSAPEQPSQMNQTSMLNQYPVNSTGLSDLPYMSTTAGPGMNGLQQQHMYNTSQTSYQ